MTDDGLTFFATIETPDGEQLHRETPNRLELIAWIAQHATRGRVVKVATEATTDDAIRNTLAALVFGAQQMAARPVDAAGEAPLVVPTRAPSTLDVARRAFRAGGGTHDCNDWLRTDGSCALCGRKGLT